MKRDILIKIDKNVPLPNKCRGIWPFASMEKGDSFLVPENKNYNQAALALRDFKMKHGGNFTMRDLGKNKIRVWCTQTPQAKP